MAVNFDLLNSTVGRSLEAKQQALENFTATLDPTSTADLLKMQQMMQEWTMMTQLQSTLVKDIGDALKGIIQKTG